MKQIVQKVAVGGVIIHEGKVLIIQRASDDDVYPNLWEVPSGKREHFEKVSDTVLREVKEETGLNTEIVKIVGAFNFVIEKPEETRDVTQINFLLKLAGESDVKLSNEHQNFAWITKDEVDNYNLSTETKSIILKAFNKN